MNKTIKMPRDFWNSNFNPITGFRTPKIKLTPVGVAYKPISLRVNTFKNLGV